MTVYVEVTSTAMEEKGQIQVRRLCFGRGAPCCYSFESFYTGGRDGRPGLTNKVYKQGQTLFSVCIGGSGDGGVSLLYRNTMRAITRDRNLTHVGYLTGGHRTWDTCSPVVVD